MIWFSETEETLTEETEDEEIQGKQKVVKSW